MLSAPRVLIVDESEESRAVLSELLQRRGAIALHSDQAELAADLTERQHPDLIVFDAESDHSDSHEATDRVISAANDSETPIIVLGSVRRDKIRIRDGQIVAKPYHYGPLIRTIDGLLAAG